MSSRAGHGTDKSLAAKGVQKDTIRTLPRYLRPAVQSHPYNLAGMRADQRMVEQNEPAVSDIQVTIPMPEGEPGVDLRCPVNSRLATGALRQHRGGSGGQ